MTRISNEYIEVVKRWQAGDVVSVEALKANAARASDAANAAARASDAANAARDAALAARDAANVAYWVKRYETLTNDGLRDTITCFQAGE